MKLLPHLIELLDSIIIDASLLLALDFLEGLTYNGHKQLQQNQTHGQEIGIEIQDARKLGPASHRLLVVV